MNIFEAMNYGLHYGDSSKFNVHGLIVDQFLPNLLNKPPEAIDQFILWASMAKGNLVPKIYNYLEEQKQMGTSK